MNEEVCKKGKRSSIEAPVAIEEIAYFLCCTPFAIYKLIEKKNLPCYKCGRRLLFFKSEVKRWLKGHKINGWESQKELF